MQLSTGLRINSGADDAAGLSIANGMTANIAALTQSGQNATNTTGLLQTADGALSQVTSLLNRAVTLATEASSEGLSSAQHSALNNEFQSILSSINNTGKNTNFNGRNVFSSAAITPFLSDGTSGNNLLGSSTMTVGTLSTAGLNIGKTSSTPASTAANTLTLGSTNLAAGTILDIGGTTYTLQTGALSAAGQIQVGSGSGATGANATLANIAAAVNGADIYNSLNPNVTAGTVDTTNAALTFTATAAGGAGNNQVVTSTGVGGKSVVAGSFSTVTLTGGVDPVAGTNSFDTYTFIANPADGATVTIDGTTYTFESNLTANGSAANQVLTDGNRADDSQFLDDAIEGFGSLGAYTPGTSQPGGGIFAGANGTGGYLAASSGSNTLAVSSNSAAVSFQTPTLQGGSPVISAASATGALILVYNPPANSTVTIDGNTYVFGAATGTQISVALGGNAPATLANLAASIGTHDNANLTASASGTILTLTATTAGAAGNSIGTVFNTAGTLSGGSLTGGVDSTATPATGTLTQTSNEVAGNNVTVGGTIYTFQIAAPSAAGEVQISDSATDSLANLVAAINGTDSSHSADENVTASANGTTLTFAANSANSGSAGNNITMTTGTNDSDDVTVSSFAGTWSSSGGTLAGGSDASSTSSADLNTPASAQSALVAITNAINIVSQSRGALGANINQLTAASNVMTSQVQNLQSADNGIMNADIGKTVAAMTQYNILQSTGMSALQQANQAQQSVLKLLQ